MAHLPVSSMHPIMPHSFLAWVMNVINLILHSYRVTDLISDISDFSDKDFNSTNSRWNSISLMTSLSPYIPHMELMTYAEFQFFSLSGFGENDVQIFPFNPIGLPDHVTFDVSIRINIFSMGSPFMFKVFCIYRTSGCRESHF